VVRVGDLEPLAEPRGSVSGDDGVVLESIPTTFQGSRYNIHCWIEKTLCGVACCFSSALYATDATDRLLDGFHVVGPPVKGAVGDAEKASDESWLSFYVSCDLIDFEVEEAGRLLKELSRSRREQRDRRAPGAVHLENERLQMVALRHELFDVETVDGCIAGARGEFGQAGRWPDPIARGGGLEMRHRSRSVTNRVFVQANWVYGEPDVGLPAPAVDAASLLRVDPAFF